MVRWSRGRGKFSDDLVADLGDCGAERDAQSRGDLLRAVRFVNVGERPFDDEAPFER